MGARDVDLVGSDRCGAPTNDGSPCRRRTNGPLCYMHAPETREEDEDTAPPEHLGEAGRRCWRYHVNRLKKHGRLERADLTVLEGAAELYQMKLNMLKTVNEEGTSVPGRNNTKKKHPALVKYDKFVSEYRMYASVIQGWLEGSSPKNEDTDDPFDF